MESADQ